MIAFALRRLGAALLVMVALSVMVFLIFFATPGVDPARQMAGRNPTPETIAAIRHEFGLDRSLPVQYGQMMNHLVISRDLESYSNRGARILPQIAKATPITLSLVAGAAVLWVVFSILLGVTAAVTRGRIWDPLLMGIALVGMSMPVFWVGEVANLLTQDRWHGSFLFSWVPPLGYTPLTKDPVLWFRHLVIPWLTLSILYIGLYSRVLRSALIETQGADFVRTARAKGLSERRVLIRHTLRTSLITFVSLFGLDLGALVAGGALLTEVVFGLPGVGRLTYRALANLDLPVIMATVLYGAFFVVLMNALVDVAYARLDPRIREAA